MAFSVVSQKDKEEQDQEERTRKRWERHYTSDEVSLDEEEFKSHYCLHCGHFSLILDARITDLPQRKTDGAFVIDESKRVVKKLMDAGETKFIRRSEGLEKQKRFLCKGCELPLAYRSDQEDGDPPCLYIFEDALTSDLALALQNRLGGR